MEIAQTLKRVFSDLRVQVFTIAVSIDLSITAFLYSLWKAGVISYGALDTYQTVMLFVGPTIASIYIFIKKETKNDSKDDYSI